MMDDDSHSHLHLCTVCQSAWSGEGEGAGEWKRGKTEGEGVYLHSSADAVHAVRVVLVNDGAVLNVRVQSVLQSLLPARRGGW